MWVATINFHSLSKIIGRFSDQIVDHKKDVISANNFRVITIK